MVIFNTVSFYWVLKKSRLFDCSNVRNPLKFPRNLNFDILIGRFKSLWRLTGSVEKIHQPIEFPDFLTVNVFPIFPRLVFSIPSITILEIHRRCRISRPTVENFLPDNERRYWWIFPLDEHTTEIQREQVTGLGKGQHCKWLS